MCSNKKHMRKLLVGTVCCIVLCSGLLVAGLRFVQEKSLREIETSVQAQPLMQSFEEILAERTSPLTGLPLADGTPENRRLTAIAVDGYFLADPMRGLSEAGIVIEAVIDRHFTRLLALYEDYEVLPEVGPLRSARRQLFEPVLPFQPLLVSQGSNVWLNELLDEYEYEPLHIKYGTYLYMDHERPSPSNVFTNGERLAQMIEVEGIDTERENLSAFFDFYPYGESHTPTEEEAGAVFVPFYIREEEIENNNNQAAYFTLNEEGKYVWHRFGYGRAMGPAIDENTGEAVAFDNLVVLFADMGLMPEEEYSMVVEFYGGVGFYFHGGSCEMIFWRKGGPLEALKLYEKDHETTFRLNAGTTYLAIVDIEDADYFFIGDAGAYEEFTNAYPRNNWW